MHLPARAPQSPITAPLICVDIDARPSHMQYHDMVNEVSTVSHLRHPNLVLFLGACTKGDEPLMILNESVAPSTCPPATVFECSHDMTSRAPLLPSARSPTRK